MISPCTAFPHAVKVYSHVFSQKITEMPVKKGVSGLWINIEM
jgi:hypothetical protein